MISSTPYCGFICNVASRNITKSKYTFRNKDIEILEIKNRTELLVNCFVVVIAKVFVDLDSAWDRQLPVVNNIDKSFHTQHIEVNHRTKSIRNCEKQDSFDRDVGLLSIKKHF